MLRTTTVGPVRDKVNTVEPKVDDQRHEPYQELLAAAAFGTLTADEQRLLKSHLDGCAECRAELAEFRAIADALPTTLDDRLPSPELRDRIAAAIRLSSAATPPPDSWRAASAPLQTAAPPAQTLGTHPVPSPTPAGKVTPFRQRYVWATAALVLLAVLAGALAGRTLFADGGEDVVRGEPIALQMDPPIPNATGELVYMPEERVFKLTMHNMPAAPADHVYQVWLIDADGPEPVGMVDQASGQFAVAADRSRYETFAITVEPGPLGSQAPTSDPIITAPLDDPTGS